MHNTGLDATARTRAPVPYEGFLVMRSRGGGASDMRDTAARGGGCSRQEKRKQKRRWTEADKEAGNKEERIYYDINRKKENTNGI
jgi:hypothetical protein